MRLHASIRLLFCAALPLVAACGPSIKTATRTPTAPPGPPVAVAPAPPLPAPPVEDPVLTLIAESDRHFKAGQEELAAGHFEGARQEFDRAIAVLAESPYGGRTEPRLREQFDRLVDRISTYEAKALAQGDGFAEKPSEPASIDQLLAESATLAPATTELSNTVSADVASSEYDIPMPLNQRVLSFVSLFQGRLHDFLQEGMKRGSRYMPMIRSVLRNEGLPLDLAYVPLVESAFKTTALSRTKAKGVWQFMRGTGIENGLRQDWYIDERSDPEKATLAAAKYLGTLARMFDGDWHMALASYNGGPGRMQRAAKRGRADDFWTLAAKPRLLPRETRDYVPMILAAIIIAKNPAQYGFEFETEEIPEYDVVTLPRAIDLRRIAEWSDTTIDEIQALNPELRRWTTPVRDEDYRLKVPIGSADLLRMRIEESDEIELASLNWHIVKKGETLATIARRLKVSRTDLAEANYLKATAKVPIGQKLMVPREATTLMASRTDLPVPVPEARPTTKDTVVAAVNTRPSTPLVKLSYQVKRGDTLASIARLFSTSVASIRQWNKLPSTQIRAGARLTIYTARAH